MATTLAAPLPRPTARARWLGRVLTGVPSLFLAVDALGKLIAPRAVVEASARLGLGGELLPVLGVLLAACLALYLVPRTATLGAVLLTGYLGGAVLAHLRVDDPLLSHTLFPAYVGACLWAGLYLRDPRVRAAIAR